MDLTAITNMRHLILTFLLILSTGLLYASDPKEQLDQSLRYLRNLQNPDGSYGSIEEQGLVTPTVLLAFSTSHRRYTDVDGPFIRKGIEWLVCKQGPEGAIRFNGTYDIVNVTALSVAAVASINKTRWSDFIEKGMSFLNRYISSEENWRERPEGPKRFHIALALATNSPEILQGLREPQTGIPEDYSPDGIYHAIWNCTKGLGIPDTFLAENLVKRIENSLRADGSTGADKEGPAHSNVRLEDRLSDEALWAGTYLLSLLDEKNKAPKDWVERISEHLIQQLDNQIRKKTRENTKRIAVLTNAVSICYSRRHSSGDLASSPERKLPPFVVSPRSNREAALAALNYLSKNQQGGKFGFSGFPDPGITALALSAVMQTTSRLGEKQPDYVKKGLNYLKELQKDDGSIYQHGLANYVTSVSIMAFMDSGDPNYNPVIEAARDFLVMIQADEGEGYSLEEDPNYGGLGYGSDERPDLSNTQMSLEALKASGLDGEHEAFQKAILFLQKCQNLSETNPTMVQVDPKKKIVSGNDGGGFYSPGASKANLEQIEEGIFVARSYGSMTYALLKSYLFAGLDPEDKRVKAAVNWIKKHYTLDENPGFSKKAGEDLGQQGIYYYYLTMARALNALQIDTLKVPGGVSHQWRPELKNKMLEIQRIDGSWINDRSPRWFEGNPVLATAYALLVLDICIQ